MNRRLIAALACRMQGTRLYGKPLQHLDIDARVTILDHLIALIRTLPLIDGIVLAIAEGDANLPFVDVARREGLPFVLGSETDVLQRLIDASNAVEATDLFRVTTESPFFYYEMVEEAWARHVEAGNDVTVIDGVPDGSHFEIYTMESLERSHRLGDERHRSEYCSLYIREHRRDFRVEVLDVPGPVARLDLRITVDYPEDLILCRKVYAHLRDHAPRLPLASIIAFLDAHPDLQALVAPYSMSQRYWDV